MAKSNIIKALEQLDKKDIYSLILFVFYKLKDVPEYSTLSELVYILDNESFKNMFTYFEGQTIKIPKIDDLNRIISSLLFYERKINTHDDDETIMKDLNIDVSKKQEILATLDLIQDILKDYDFGG